jgi:hypothetical protein
MLIHFKPIIRFRFADSRVFIGRMQDSAEESRKLEVATIIG